MQTGEWTPDDIKALRAALCENVATFGARFSRSGRTVEDWEQGRRKPDPLVQLVMAKIAARAGRAKRINGDSQ